MKYTRIFLFLSPLMLFCPPLIPLHDTLAMSMLGMFYGTILRRFPWNLLMAGLTYSYAQQLGRDSFRWAGSSFIFPFFVPVILGFMPAKFRSTADNVRQALAKPAAAVAASGPFQERFPLLQRCLAGQPESRQIELGARFSPVVSNFEFAALVQPAALDKIVAEATMRQFTVWPDTVADGTQLYGAGMVETPKMEEVTAWLKRTGIPGEKLSVAWRQPDGALKFFEYYPM